MSTTIRRCWRLVAVLLLAGCASSSVNLSGQQLAGAVDLDRYAGRWYVIAHIPYFPERGKVGTYEEYRRRPDGRLDNFYYFRKKTLDNPVQRWDAVARVVDGTGNAAWKIRFFWPLSFDYLILAVDEDYQWSVVGYPDRKLAWIFSRSPQMDDALYQRLLGKLKAQGYDSDALVRIPQLP